MGKRDRDYAEEHGKRRRIRGQNNVPFHGLVPRGYNYLGPFNAEDTGLPTNDNDAIAAAHDEGYQELIEEGIDPYLSHNEVDDVFLDNLLPDDIPTNVAQGLFTAKKAVTRTKRNEGRYKKEQQRTIEIRKKYKALSEELKKNKDKHEEIGRQWSDFIRQRRERRREQRAKSEEDWEDTTRHFQRNDQVQEEAKSDVQIKREQIAAAQEREPDPPVQHAPNLIDLTNEEQTVTIDLAGNLTDQLPELIADDSPTLTFDFAEFPSSEPELMSRRWDEEAQAEGMEVDTNDSGDPEPAAARASASSGGNQVSKETQISIPPTLTYGLQETHTTILPWRCWFINMQNCRRK